MGASPPLADPAAPHAGARAPTARGVPFGRGSRRTPRRRRATMRRAAAARRGAARRGGQAAPRGGGGRSAPTLVGRRVDDSAAARARRRGQGARWTSEEKEELVHQAVHRYVHAFDAEAAARALEVLVASGCAPLLGAQNGAGRRASRRSSSVR